MAAGTYTLRWADGTIYTSNAFANVGSGGAFLTSITDLNGNTTTLTRNPSQPLQLLVVTDPVGRNLTFLYDGSNRVTQISDPIGHVVKYTYNSQGTLAAYTDANGGTTKYTYDSSNNLSTITDPRGVLTEQNSYNESFDGRISQQVEADGGVYTFAYTLQNPNVPTSSALQTVVTDPLGNQTTYRFDNQSFLLSALDPTGQIRTLTHDANNNNLVISYSGGAEGQRTPGTPLGRC